MKIFTQLGIIFAISLAGTYISGILPFTFPASVLGMVILFLLLCFKIIKEKQVEDVSNFLIHNMAFFFIPSCVKILEVYDLIKNSIFQIFIISVISTIVTFAVTAWTIKFVIFLQHKLKGETR